MRQFPRVKFFTYNSDNLAEMESDINEWLQEYQDIIKVINIQYTSTLAGETDDCYAEGLFSVCIFYETN